MSPRLTELYAGRPVLLGPGVLAGFTRQVEWFASLGCPVLVVATARGAGDVPDPSAYELVQVPGPPTGSLTDELRLHDRIARDLPAYAIEAIEAFDPQQRGVWFTTPFVTTDQPVLGRPVTGGRPAAWLELEDKVLADAVWDAAGVDRAPSAVVPVAEARDGLLAGPLGAVWSGDARDGFNGGAEYVRWVRDGTDGDVARWFFARHCDRVRVMPFLDGVPCSVHGMVLPDGTAAFRPVEIVMLRDPVRRRFVYGGLGTYWDPPAADREAMRSVARRVGEHLRTAYDYRGAFGIDGVLTEDGFLPTELNTRMSAGLTLLAEVDRWFFTLVQAHLVAGRDPGLGVADLEAWVPLMDAERRGKVSAHGDVPIGGDVAYPVAYEHGRFTRVDDADSVFSAGDTSSGFFAQVSPCTALRPGERVAPVNAALFAHLDEAYGTSFGTLEAAPDLRR